MEGARVVDVAVEDWWVNGVGPLAGVTGGGTCGVMGMVVETGYGGNNWREGELRQDGETNLGGGVRNPMVGRRETVFRTIKHYHYRGGSKNFMGFRINVLDDREVVKRVGFNTGCSDDMFRAYAL